MVSEPEPPADAPRQAEPFRLAVVPGARPQRWVRTWRERLPDVPLTLLAVEVHEQETALGGADAGLVRLPVDRDRFEAIPLYTETTVVVVPKDHLLAAGAELSPADLAEEVLLVPLDDVLGLDPPAGVERPPTTAAAVELVAAGIGVLLVPQSLARLHHRRDLTYREVTEEPTTTVALAWPRGRASDLVEELIGIVRGRTANSSRGRGAPARQGAHDGSTAGAPGSGRAATRRVGGPAGPTGTGARRPHPARPTWRRAGAGPPTGTPTRPVRAVAPGRGASRRPTRSAGRRRWWALGPGTLVAASSTSSVRARV